MPVGFPVVPGWYLEPGLKVGSVTVLPGGMAAVKGTTKFIMIVAGWVLFNGTPPL